MALTKLAIEHFEKHQRPLRIAIDAAIWNFQTQSGQGGKNPALRTLFFRLLKLLALPIHPVFVYDGKNKPLTKRGKTVSRYGTCVPNEMSKNLVARFQFPHHTAPGEAEAECAFLQQNGIVDAVMSQDVDTIMFGSTLTLRDWSKEGTKGNKTPTHVNVLESAKIKEISGLDSAGMILVALLSGGDYHEGIQGFGPALSCQIAKAGFGEELAAIIKDEDEQSLKDWRDRLQYELETNESGYFSKRHKTVKLPDTFPDRIVLGYYTTPAVSDKPELKRLEARWLQWWGREIDIPALRDYTAMTFDWLYKGGARKYIRCLAQPLFQHRLKRRQVHADEFSMRDVTEKRKHFITDGIPELRFTATPVSVVGIDLDAEEDNPEFAELEFDEEADIELTDGTVRETSTDPIDEPSSPSKRRRRPPWDPCSPEKWWIPETLLKCGMPNVVDAWHAEQLSIRADPLKFATRKCKPPTKARGKKIDHGMRDGAIEGFLPINKAGKDIPPRVKKPMERAKTDTALLQSSQQRDVGTFFKPSKSSKTALFTTAGSRAGKATALEPPLGSDSDEELDVDFLDHLHKTSKATQPWLTRSKDDLDCVDAVSSPSVTQRKKRPQKTSEETDDDIVCIGSKPLMRPVSSLSDSQKDLKFGREVTGQGAIHRDRRSERENVPASVEGRDSSLAPATLTKGNEAAGMRRTAPASEPPTYQEYPTASTLLAQVDIPKLTATRAVTKMAILRESLPGTWKEAPFTPSQNSGVAFVDLTNT